MSAKRKHADDPVEILMPMDEFDEAMASPRDDHNPRTSAAMRDGDSSHGGPSDSAVDEFTTDNDAGDAVVHPVKRPSRR